MRLIHTSDWHLGRHLKGKDRTPEIEFTLNELLRQAQELEVDAVLIAGDIFETPNPPSDAERVAYQFFEGLRNAKIPAIAIAGNHDSASRFDGIANLLSLIETEWETNLLSTNFTEQIFQQSKVSPEVQSQWQEKIDDYNTNKIQLQTNVKRETDAIGDKNTNAEIIAQQEKFVVDAGEKDKQAQDEYNDLKLLIVKAEEQREQLEKLQTQLSSKQQELETYQLLSKELRSDRFQDYILQHFERELVEVATVFLLELTEQRYALKYENKEYKVEDNWSCGETRRVQTLSGGETFATSLSLALALSEKLSRGAKLGSLFIDEGFGTLDAETLKSVSNILLSLGKQDRLVGVITHVPALGEELGTQIKVEKFLEGSRIVVTGILA